MSQRVFDSAAFLAIEGQGRREVHLNPGELFFAQGDRADSVFYLQKGRAKVSIVSKNGKGAVISLVSSCDFLGEEALAAKPGMRLTSAAAIDACTALKITREEMLRLIHEKHEVSSLFIKFLLARTMRIQSDLVDQLFNSSEKRLARLLLLMAEFGQHGDPEALLPEISQQTLAEMVGTTRSRVSHFMNRFRQLGFIKYKGRIRVHRSLMNVVLVEESDQNPCDPHRERTLDLAGR